MRRACQIGAAIAACAVIAVALLYWVSAPKAHQSDISGTYVAEYRTGRETVLLDADGTYHQEIALESSSESIINNGSWDWNGSSQELLLRDCLWVSDGRGDIRPDFRQHVGDCLYKLRRRWYFFGQLLMERGESGTLWRQ